jgi:hypothetical protein
MTENHQGNGRAPWTGPLSPATPVTFISAPHPRLSLKEKYLRRIRRDRIMAALYGTGVIGLIVASYHVRPWQWLNIVLDIVTLVLLSMISGRLSHARKLTSLMHEPMFYLVAMRHDLGSPDKKS